MVASRRPAWAVAVLPTVALRSSTTWTPPRALAMRPAARAFWLWTATLLTASAVQRRSLEGGLPGLAAEVGVDGLAEAVLPRAGVAVARAPPTLGELVGDRGAAQVLGDHVALADEGGRGAVAARGLLGTGRPAGAQVGADHERGPARVERGAQGADAGPDGAAGVHGQRAGIQPECGVDRRGVGLVQVGGGRRGEPQTVGRGAGSAPERQPTGLDGHGRRVLVVGGHGAGALAPALAQHAPDVAPLEAVVGDVARHADQSSHGFGGYFWTNPARASGAGQSNGTT